MITLYTKPKCSGCEQAKAALGDIAYTEATIDNSKEGLNHHCNLLSVLSDNDCDTELNLPVLVFADTPFMLNLTTGKWQRLRSDFDLTLAEHPPVRKAEGKK